MEVVGCEWQSWYLPAPGAVGRNDRGNIRNSRRIHSRRPVSPASTRSPAHTTTATKSKTKTATTMTARRQPSTTSLSQYARNGSPDPTMRSLDYCNSFWGLADGGVDVLFARMRGASRTMEELRNFWKERCVALACSMSRQAHCHIIRALIEEDYAKRLAKLSKSTVGRDEIGYVCPPPSPSLVPRPSLSLARTIIVVHVEHH
jgi:hypothetical protein